MTTRPLIEHIFLQSSKNHDKNANTHAYIVNNNSINSLAKNHLNSKFKTASSQKNDDFINLMSMENYLYKKSGMNHNNFERVLDSNLKDDYQTPNRTYISTNYSKNITKNRNSLNRDSQDSLIYASLQNTIDGKSKTSSRKKSNVGYNAGQINYDDYINFNEKYDLSLKESNEKKYDFISDKKCQNLYNKYVNFPINRNNDPGSLEIEINSDSMSPNQDLSINSRKFIENENNRPKKINKLSLKDYIIPKNSLSSNNQENFKTEAKY